MNSYLVILLLIFIVIIVTYVEFKITRRNTRFSINCPKTFSVIEHDGHKFIFYKAKHKNEVNEKVRKEDVRYYKITPRITIPQRLKVILNKSKIDSININNIVSSVVPIVMNIFDILTINQKSNYRILTTDPKAEATTDEHHIYIS